MRFYQLSGDLKRHYINVDLKGIKDLKSVILKVAKIKSDLIFDSVLNCYSIYVENIPKKMCDFKEITIIIEGENIRYFNGLY